MDSLAGIIKNNKNKNTVTIELSLVEANTLAYVLNEYHVDLLTAAADRIDGKDDLADDVTALHDKINRQVYG
jgi:methylthioribose-1-phosphate isomerase